MIDQNGFRFPTLVHVARGAEEAVAYDLNGNVVNNQSSDYTFCSRKNLNLNLTLSNSSGRWLVWYPILYPRVLLALR